MAQRPVTSPGVASYAEAYRNLGRMYVDDERFRANYEKITEGLAAYQRDAVAVYARERLS